MAKLIQLRDRKTSEKQYPVTIPQAVVDSNGRNILDIVKEMYGGGPLSMAINTTYFDLKTLRDNGGLNAGQVYRITDYKATTTTAGTTSWPKPFDILTMAIDSSHLSEECLAAPRDGSTYFKNNNLSAWRVWYSLDNDTNRFAWADTANGKGVIYRLIDEHGNDCPYDFKSIQFTHPHYANSYGYCYTFTFISDSDGDELDMSLDKRCRGNVIRECYESGKRILNKIVFLDDEVGAGFSGNVFGVGCKNNTILEDCHNNIFGANFVNNIIRQHCSNNVFLDNCSDTFLGGDCVGNSFGANCGSNSLALGCKYNTFGSNCYGNSLRGACNSNTFGNECRNNDIEYGCHRNSFGNYCNQNTLVGSCYGNSFGNVCYKNSLGENCMRNSFGNYCNINTLGNDSNNNNFGNSCAHILFQKGASNSVAIAYCRNNRFGDGCQYIKIANNGTASENNQVQNYLFAQGLRGTSSSYIVIEAKRGRAYETKVAKNSSGTVLAFCEADYA